MEIHQHYMMLSRVWECFDKPGRTHMVGFVVRAAVAEHQPEVCDALLGTVVDTVIQLLLDGAHVHGIFDDSEIILTRNESENHNFCTYRMSRSYLICTSCCISAPVEKCNLQEC